jgi:protoporphyrinogen oxidase
MNKNKNIKKICIIGGGPAGLTAAYKLIQNGQKVSVYEANKIVGGMSKTFKLWGQLVDLGPHRFFSDDPRVNKLWLEVVGDRYSMVNRKTRIYFDNKFFDYPLKPLNALLNLGFFRSTVCVISYIRYRVFPLRNKVNFETWVINRFGKKLYEIFFKSYREKLWGIKCDELDVDFASQRIKKLSLYEAIKNSFLSNKNSHKTLVDLFAYPNNGTGFVYDNLKNKITKFGGKIFLNKRIKSLKIMKNDVLVKLSNGKIEKFDHVISTMPITNLVNNLNNVPKYVKKNLSKLYFRNTILVYLKVNKKKIFSDQWIYLHSKNLSVGRITNFSNWNSKINNNSKDTILCMEFWCYNHDVIWKSNDKDISLLAIRELIKTNLVSSKSIINTKVLKIPKCYPVYFKNYKKNLSPVIKYLKTLKRLSVIGRYGSYKYNNQDHSILMGILVAENLTSKKKHDLWSVNTDYEYQEKSEITKTGLKINN